MNNPSTPHHEPAQPAGPSSLKWCYPFPGSDGKEITDPQQVYLALSRMEDGFFPLGVNGFPHGGVHFGAGSAGLLDQSGGVRSIANGEIVAYRIDSAYPQLHFTQDGRWAMYSTGFVLMRHHMTLPPAPGSTASQPPDETLTFYSLYMHLADWNTYLTQDLRRPGWWLGVEAWRIQNRDRQTGGDAVGALVRTAPKARAHGRFRAGEPVGFLPEGSEVTIGERQGEWGHIEEIRAGGMVSATSGAPFGTDELNAPWVRPFEDRAERMILTREGDWGWINLHDNECLTEPSPLDVTVIPPQPIPVPAGMLLGQLGEYHDYERSTPLPPVAKRQLLHLEVFAGSAFSAFLEKSRTRAAQLPADQRTVLLVQPGAKLVESASAPNLTLGQRRPLAELEPVADSPARGPWVKVQPLRAERIVYITHIVPDGPEVWVERRHADRFTSPDGLPAWSEYPLQLRLAAAPVNAHALAFSRAQLDGLKAEDQAVDDHGAHWWKVSVGIAEGGTRTGWVCEKAHPGTAWESPWAWPGFGIVDATGISLTDAFRRNLAVTGSADWQEAEEFEPSTQAVNGSALLLQLEQTVARMPLPDGHKRPEPGPDGRAVVTASKLQQALRTRWVASELGRVILQYESEWGGNMARWDAITPLMRNARENWTCELQRIRKLQWWDDVKGKVEGFPADPVVHHIHPIELVCNFHQGAEANAISEDGIWFIFAHEAQANVTNHLHWPHGASGVTLGAGYDMKERTPGEIVADMTSIGLSADTARTISKASMLRGDAANTFANTNRHLVDLTDDQQVQLLRHTIGAYENKVRHSIKVKLQKNEFDALVSFAYNPAGRWGSVAKFINDGQVESAMAKIREGNTSGGIVYAGLTHRRSDEVNLYKSNKYEFNGHALPRR